MGSREPTDFERRVYEKVKEVPRGRVTSYGELAKAVGERGAARAVGNALNRNPFSDVPCHRVVLSDMNVGGFARGKEAKIRILREEGVLIKGNRVIGELFRFNPTARYINRFRKSPSG